MEKTLIQLQQEVKTQLGNKETFNALVNTTFKGLAPAIVPQAILEGIMRGYEFKDFLQKNVYAIPFRDGYSLVSSIDWARKIGMRSGVVGKSAPTYEEKDGKIISCSITIKRKVMEYVGEYTATVYFSEYSTGKNLWQNKPRTMIAKVAEMHALRMACPEELSQVYTEEEKEREIIEVKNEVNVDGYKAKLEGVKSLAELQTVWAAMPVEAKTAYEGLKNEIKAKYAEKK